MKLGDSGEAFFVEEVTPSELGDDEIIPPHLACSPIPDDDFPPHFHSGGGTISEIHDNTQINVEWHEKNVDITYSCQQSSYEGVQNVESNADLLPKDSSQVYNQISSQDDSAESSVTKENVDLHKPVLITAGTSAPKTFCAETVSNDDSESEKVRRISIVAADFRPISLIVEDDVPAIRNDEVLLADDSLDGQNATEESNSYEQSSSHGLVRKDMGKENSAPSSEDLLKPNSGGKRKRRRKSVMKKKGAAQRKNGVGSNSQIEQLEVNDTNGLVKTSVEIQQGVIDDSSDQGIFQIEDLNSQTEDGSSQEVCISPLHVNL
jgi:phosphatidate phosphatase LPIN